MNRAGSFTWSMFLCCSMMLLPMCAAGADLEVGVGRRDITPVHEPVFLAGYAAREKPSTGAVHQVWTKAIVFKDGTGGCAVIITADLIEHSRVIINGVMARLKDKHGLRRDQVIFNASHTHSSSVTGFDTYMLFKLSVEDQKKQAEYNLKLIDDIVGAVDMAMGNLAPALISSGWGTAGFAINRRKRAITPTDHAVPVLKITGSDGKVRAVVFGYACHNTTVTGQNLLVNGDYAGFAQIELEGAHPGATALFIQGCGADQNPDPRGTVEHAEKYGRELAEAVKSVLSCEMKPVVSPVRTALVCTQLAFAPSGPDRYLQDILGKKVYEQYRAMLLLNEFNRGIDVRSIPYPIQVLRFGEDFSLLALSGEVVVDYSLRLKKEYEKENLFVAGYCNDVTAYIPSLRVLEEGGYEGGESMVYFGLPAPFTRDVEETVIDSVHKIMEEAGAGKNRIPDFRAEAEAFNNTCISNGFWTGAAMLVGTPERVLFRKAWGWIDREKTIPMPADAIFDLASVTKVVGATTALAICIDRNLINPDSAFTNYLPGYRGKLQGNVTVRDLARHISGFNNSKAYDREGQVTNLILELDPVSPVGQKYCYSCANFILLGLIVENVTGRNLDDFCHENIFKPLGMNDTRWAPIPDPDPRRVVRQAEVQTFGVPSDPPARNANHPVGNAGLFSTVDDLSLFCRMMLSGGMAGKKRIISESMMRTLGVRPDELSPASFGWRVDPEYNPPSLSGGTMSHTGWAGNSVWIDPIHRRYVVVLTNRMGENAKVAKARKELADCVLKAFKKVE